MFCCNPRHEKLAVGQSAAAHWDIDELLELMEWTRRRVGPRGRLVIIHNTTTPMFATGNFADDVVANEWGYGKWFGKGPNLQELPLEWSLVGARARGVISYGQLDAQASGHLHRLFALEDLLAGVTPWPASTETFQLYPVLRPILALGTCRFADWRNHAATVHGGRAASAIYSRPDESWLLIGNLDETTQEVRCTLHPDELPYPIASVTTVTLVASSASATNLVDGVAPVRLEPSQLTGSGVTLTIPAAAAVLLHVGSDGTPGAFQGSSRPARGSN